jgi:5-oxoprolinase (ATP-hydrolysing)
VLIDNFLLVDRAASARRRPARCWAPASIPCRNIRAELADLRPRSPPTKGARELKKMVDQFGLDVVHAYMGHVQDNAEESGAPRARRAQGRPFRLPMDDGKHIKVAITIDRAQRRAAVIDFTGTSPQQAPATSTRRQRSAKAAVLYVFRTLVDDAIPLNEGCLKPLTSSCPTAACSPRATRRPCRRQHRGRRP